MLEARDPIVFDASEQMVLIPGSDLRFKALFAPWEGDLDVFRRFVLDRLASVKKFVEVRDDVGDIWVRVPITVNLVPRPDNAKNREAISVAAPPSYGGSVIERHLGYMFERTLHRVGEGLRRLADAASPRPVGCRAWVVLRALDSWVYEDDQDWEVTFSSPLSRTEVLQLGYWFDRIQLDLPDSMSLEGLVNRYIASAPQAAAPRPSQEDEIRTGLLGRFAVRVGQAYAKRVATGVWGVETERSRARDQRDTAALLDIESWTLFRSIAHDYEGIRAISRSVWGNDRVLITDHAGLEIGQCHLPNGPLTLVDERTRPDAIAALRAHGVDVALPADFADLDDYPDALIRTDRLRDDPVNRERIWSIRLVRDRIPLQALPEAGKYDPESDVLTVYARLHRGPMVTLLRRHGVRPATVQYGPPAKDVAERSRWAELYAAADLGPFLHEEGGRSGPEYWSIEPVSCNLTQAAIDLVPPVHRRWLNASIVHGTRGAADHLGLKMERQLQSASSPELRRALAEQFTGNMSDFMLDSQRRRLTTLFNTTDIAEGSHPCRLCGAEGHSTRSGLAYCWTCCHLAIQGILKDNGTDGPWTDATIWAIRRLAEIEFSGPPSRAQLHRIELTDPALADEAMLCRFLIPRTYSVIARPARKPRKWANWLRLAGLLSNATRSARGVQTVATDGHPCRSMFERHIDDFLHHHRIEHEVEPHYPRHHILNATGLRADWLLADGTYVEALGMLQDDAYAAKATRKIELARLVGIRLITILPEDLGRIGEIFAEWTRTSPP